MRSHLRTDSNCTEHCLYCTTLDILSGLNLRLGCNTQLLVRTCVIRDMTNLNCTMLDNNQVLILQLFHKLLPLLHVGAFSAKHALYGTTLVKIWLKPHGFFVSFKSFLIFV